MATAFISDKKKYVAKTLKAIDYAVIRLNNRKYPLVKIEEDLPFRIKFTNITIPGYGPNNVPGIGLQVIGYNNYIL